MSIEQDLVNKINRQVKISTVRKMTVCDRAAMDKLNDDLDAYRRDNPVKVLRYSRLRKQEPTPADNSAMRKKLKWRCRRIL